MSDALDLASTDSGVLLNVRVTPRSSRTQLDGVANGALRVKLKEPPVDGAANKGLCDLLAKVLKCRKSQVEIVRGLRSRDKTVRIVDLGASSVRQALER